MHEASLAGGILQLVEQSARRDGFVRALRLQIAVGQLAGVELRALQFALEAIAPGTVLDGCRFDFSEPPGQAWCLACSRSSPLRQRGDGCAHCGSFQLQPTGGTELQVVDLWVADADETPTPEPEPTTTGDPPCV